jgi:hypothetical protein
MIGRLTAATFVLTLAASAAGAQPPPPPAEPSTPARVEVGPLSLRPALILRDVGFDSNVFNTPEGGDGDFTATFGAKVDVGVRSSRIQGTYSSFYEYIYFQTFRSERGANRGTDGRVDFLLGRVKPYLTAGLSHSHERPSAEIDTRPLRVQSSVGFGTSVAAFSRTTFAAGYRRGTVDYADEETFRGVRLADQLNGSNDAVVFGADVELSPLTTVSIHGERSQERFDFSPDRDADSYRYGVTATLHPLALISGRASIGVRAFRPLSHQVRDFTGLTAAIAVAYAHRDETRLALTIDRDLRFSFAEETPYYISTGGRVTLTHRLFGNLDGQALAGVERIAYEPRLDVADAGGERDTVATAGGGIGYRLDDGSRLGFNIDRAVRSSPAAGREYTRLRMYGTLTYGF